MKRVFAVAALAMVLLSGCGGTDRPEGAVERWLVSLNQGKAGEPEKYAPEALSQRILPRWESRDPGDLDVIEVGKGQDGARHALVPFRVERSSGLKIDGLATVNKVRGEWRVVGIGTERRGVRVPSEGGEPIASASAGAWGIALGISAVLMLMVALVMSLTPNPAALPTRKQ